MTVGSIGPDADLMASLAQGRTANRNLESLDELLERFERGEFDPVGVGRAMVAEPDWPRIVRRGELQRLKPFGPEILASLSKLLPDRDT